jgi:glycerol-3-phosphate dehydrogenase
LNYTKVVGLLRRRDGQVCGVQLVDQSSDGEKTSFEVPAAVVINATGAWADELRSKVSGKVSGVERLRLLRGSHVLLPADKVPISRAISFWHPHDQRPVFIFPWEGTVIVGTTDVDHRNDLNIEPSISSAEAEYLIVAARYAFPSLNISLEDVQATLSGIRAVVDTGKNDPSKESREHVLWLEKGLLTVTGGKLTTFRVMAHDALRAIRHRLPGVRRLNRRARMFEDAPVEEMALNHLSAPARLRLAGRYGVDAPLLVKNAKQGELEQLPGTLTLLAELRWALHAEAVLHLDDLLLRRVRIGLTIPDGAVSMLDHIRQIVQSELKWSDQEWQSEVEAYTKLIREAYQLPDS